MNGQNVVQQLEDVPFLGNAQVKKLEFLLEKDGSFIKATIENEEDMTILCIRTRGEEGMETMLCNISHIIGRDSQPDFHWTMGPEMMYAWANEGKLSLVRKKLLKGRCAKNLFQRIAN